MIDLRVLILLLLVRQCLQGHARIVLSSPCLLRIRRFAVLGRGLRSCADLALVVHGLAERQVFQGAAERLALQSCLLSVL